MRKTFITTLLALAEADPDIWLLNADLGFSFLEPFAERFPGRYLNVGVAEQNMIGVATGLALSGAKVFAYSIANFPTLRCLEQIRNDVCYHRAHVVVVAVGAGFAYGSQGYTHHAIEDLAVMRALPGMRVGVPGNRHETKALVTHFAREPGPAYLRLGRDGEPAFHAGHNPLGALMMLALMALVLSLGFTGWLQTTDRFWGDEGLQELHETLGSALMLLAGVHAAAAIVMGRLEGVNLVAAMVTGVKRRR